MTSNLADSLLSIVRPEALNRIYQLTERTPLTDLTTLEALAILAILEAADQRLNAPEAPVLRLAPTPRRSGSKAKRNRTAPACV